MNMAVAGAAHYLDGYEINPVAGSKECQQHFRLDLESIGGQIQAGPSGQIDEAKAALSVGQVPASFPRELAAHPAVHVAAEPGNCFAMVHPITQNKAGPRALG